MPGPGDSPSVRLLRVIEGSYRPSPGEALELAGVARLNKLYLAFLRSVGFDVLWRERRAEEWRFKRYIRGAVDVVRALEGLRYALYKFRKPVEHVSVDLDVLIHGDDVSRAVRRLLGMGFRVDVVEPYTVTLRRGGFIVDLYTHPAFAWAVYMDGLRLLREESEDIEVWGVYARGLSREAEVAVAAAHAVYKEQVYLLIDHLTITKWLNRRAIGVALEHGVERALEASLGISRAIEEGRVEAPYKIPIPRAAHLILDKTLRDPAFRATLPNIIKYLLTRDKSGHILLWKLTRKTY